MGFDFEFESNHLKLFLDKKLKCLKKKKSLEAVLLQNLPKHSSIYTFNSFYQMLPNAFLPILEAISNNLKVNLQVISNII